LQYDGAAWMGLGVSSNGQMIGSQAVIGLPDKSSLGIYSLQFQDVTGIVPLNSSSLTETSVQQGSGTTTMTWTQPLQGGGYSITNATYFIYAIGASNTLAQHTQKGSFVIKDLTYCLANGSLSGGLAGNSTSPATTTTVSNLPNYHAWIAHALLMAISWTVIIPIAIGSSMLRGFLGIGSSWIRYHVVLNTLAYIMILAAFGTAIYCIRNAHGPHFAGNTHKFLGLIIVILVGLQQIFGYLRPHLPTAKPIETTETGDNANVYEQDEVVTKQSKSAARIAFEISHRLFGAGLLALGWYQCYTGVALFGIKFGFGFNAELTYWIVLGCVSGTIVLLWLFYHICMYKKPR
jgi:hypothetical protein